MAGKLSEELNEYAAIFDEIPVGESLNPVVMAELTKFCDGINEAVKPERLCNLEYGYLTPLGREVKVTLFSELGYRSLFLRAYVLLKDFPVALDGCDEEYTMCEDILQLNAELFTFLRKNEAVILK